MSEFNLYNFKEEQKKLRSEVWGRLIVSLLAAFGFVVALSWNDAIKSVIDYYFPLGSSGLVPKFVYAIALTIGVAVIGFYLSKLAAKKEEK